jgi:hypothetical protein
MTQPTPADDLTTAYANLNEALSALLEAAIEAGLDPDTLDAIAELPGSIFEIVVNGIGVGICVLAIGSAFI